MKFISFDRVWHLKIKKRIYSSEVRDSSLSILKVVLIHIPSLLTTSIQKLTLGLHLTWVYYYIIISWHRSKAEITCITLNSYSFPILNLQNQRISLLLLGPSFFSRRTWSSRQLDDCGYAFQRILHRIRDWPDRTGKATSGRIVYNKILCPGVNAMYFQA